VELLVKAVETVASCVKDQQDGRLFPQIKDLADVSKKVALAVACNRQDLI